MAENTVSTENTSNLNTSGENGEVARPDTSPAQTPETDAAFARVRREAEAKARAKFEAEKAASPEIALARGIIADSVFRRDLEAIRAAHPEVEAKDLTALGESFLRIMAAAEGAGFALDPVLGYEAAAAYDAKLAHEMPPSMGSAGAGDNVEHGFYSAEEVDRLTDAELSDPRVFRRVRESMAKWGRG